MRIHFLTSTIAALCLALPTTAQKLTSGSVSGTRAETRILVYGENFNPFALATITHGQPVWKDEYDGQMDKLKGKVNRLGMDWFTTLTNSAEFEIGGTKLPAGSYIVGLHCDKDGKFALAFMDAGKAMKDGVNPFMDWKPEFTAPMTLNKGTAKESVAKLTMTLADEKGGGGKGTLTIAWGKHTLTAPVMLNTKK